MGSGAPVFRGRPWQPRAVNASSAKIARRASTSNMRSRPTARLQKVELPFVMGVMSDLSGQSQVEKKALDKRDFVEFDMDNFDQRMEAIAPRAAFNVDNTLTGDGQLSVDLTFKTIEDFSPGKVAKSVPRSRETARSASAAQRPAALHGRQGWRAGIARPAAEGSGAAEGDVGRETQRRSRQGRSVRMIQTAKAKPAQPIPEGTKK